MLITNLSGVQGTYDIDPELIEESLDESYSSFRCPEMERYPYKNAHLSEEAGIMPFYLGYWLPVQFNIVRQVPIFLVSKQQCLKTFTVGYFGYKDDVTVPLDILPDEVSDSDIIEESDYEDVYPYKGERNRDNSIASCIDRWGLYTREYPNGRDYRIDESHPRIFIWVDKIYDFVNGDSHNYWLLASQVILHELAHAMMDINLTGALDYQANNKFNKTFYTLKEESLANAISLTLIKPHISDKDWNFLVSVVKQQPFQYALGLEYLDRHGRVIESSIGKWMLLKECGRYSKQVAEEWIRYVKGKRPLDCGQLELLDEGMWDPDGLFRYPASTGHFYSNRDVAVKVIKDYIVSNPSISRAELHAAFPDAINDHYESIIDYPESTEFHGKNGLNSHTHSVDDDKIFDCIDGKIAICDYWSYYSMDKFVDNASALGYEIERFQ